MNDDYRDCPIPYDHYEDGVSIQWAFQDGGIVRFHTPGTADRTTAISTLRVASGFLTPGAAR